MLIANLVESADFARQGVHGQAMNLRNSNAFRPEKKLSMLIYGICIHSRVYKQQRKQTFSNSYFWELVILNVMLRTRDRIKTE